MASILSSKSFVVLTAVLLAQAGVFYGFNHNENIPHRQPLSDFSLTVSTWRSLQELEMGKEELEILNADDVLSRYYRDDVTGRSATLFVAYFNTQRTGKAPHSPKNCLPGSGWVPTENSIVELSVPGQSQPIQANRYVVSRGDSQSVVLYWYQSHNRTVASEYWAKYYTVVDSLRYNRSDTALVRVVVTVGPGPNGVEHAFKTASDFVAAFYPQLKQHLPA